MGGGTEHREPGSKGLFSSAGQGLAFRTRKSRGNPELIAARKASLAEFVAEGGSIQGWVRREGLSSGRGSQIWALIVADMGAQAI
ncbi:MAG: hypothetical protein CMN73_04255 [Sphingomonas sp.]|nr:hypothetical protein [Sphingomonas sp.]|tara:strand:- start:261 stop:515 length:255 start_codon:yes stop_codon:yes gene_type:complete